MKTKQIFLNVDIDSHDQQKVIKINFDRASCQEICLMLCLLREKLVNTIELKFNNFSLFLGIQNGNQSFYSILDLQKGTFKAAISLNSLEYALYFLLKYYRDGVGEADHIDIDFQNRGGDECTLIFKCDEFTEYTSEEIVKKINK